jgi:hypothetical protein
MIFIILNNAPKKTFILKDKFKLHPVKKNLNIKDFIISRKSRKL